MCGTLSNFHRQTVSQFLVFSAKVYTFANFFKISRPQKFMPVKCFKIGHPRNFKNFCKILKIFTNVVGNCSSYVKILESQGLQRGSGQSNHNNLFTFNFYIFIFSFHHRNSCMAIGALGHTYVRLHVAGIQNVFVQISLEKYKSNMIETKIMLFLHINQFLLF